MAGQSRRLPSFLLPSPATVTSFTVLYAHFIQQRWSSHIQPSGDRAKSACKAHGDHGVQFSTVPQSCPTLCDPMKCSTPGLPVHHQLPEFIQTHIHQIGDAIQPSHSLSSPSPAAFNLSQHQGLFNEKALCIRSDQISRSVMSDSLRPHESQHARPPCPSPTPRVH